ncbi:MAG: Ca-activated chloride channel [Acidobacteriota bacterium]|nr:Ca-activated chloride channel [Acidobacteriota bacterium]
MRERTLQNQTRQRALLCVALVALVAWCATLARASLTQAQASDGDTVTVDLPATGEVRIENQRGGIALEVWNEDYLSISYITDGATIRADQTSPVKLDRTDTQLSITIASEINTRETNTRGATLNRHAAPTRRTSSSRRATSLRRVPLRAAASTQSNAASAGKPNSIKLIVRVPARARVSIVTTDGAVEVRGAPARLDVQTVAGDVRLSIAPSADADISARTLYGAINVGAGFGAGSERTLHERFSTRLGAGSRILRLSTVRGRIALEQSAEIADVRNTNNANASPARVVETQPMPPASQPRRPPVLIGANEGGATQNPASKPTPKAGAPVEVSEDEVLTVDTSVVTLNFSVVDRQSGRALTNLIGADFKVTENNVEQQITHFEQASAPFDLVLLLDLSGSTAHVTDLIRGSARRFVDSVRAADRVGIIAFASAPQVVAPLTTDKQNLHARIDAMGAPQGDTKLYDAINYSLDYLEANSPKQRRRAIVLLTDGMDSALPNVTGEGSKLPYPELKHRVQEFDGLFYAVMTDNYEEPQSPLDVQPETYDLAWDRMEELTKEAGGLYYEAGKLEDVADIYAHVVEDLGTVYSISYLPTNKARDGSFRAVHVRLPRRPEAIARGRSGYYAK